jgi:CBS domain-containing protein
MNLSQVCELERPPLLLRARAAAELMTPNPVSLRETVTAGEAAAFLTERGISAAPVINEAGAPVGVLSQTDLVVHDRETVESLASRRRRGENSRQLSEEEDLVRDLMTPTVFTVRLEAPAAQVVEDMLALRVHRLFVVDGGGVLVGVVTATDILRRLEPAPEQDL